MLDCVGMTDLARGLEKKAGVPALDGVACAISLAESLIRIGLRTSKRNTYAPPLAKPYAGEFARFSREADTAPLPSDSRPSFPKTVQVRPSKSKGLKTLGLI